MNLILNIENNIYEFKSGVNNVTGINGSGKTTFVKKIISNCDENMGICITNKTVFENMKLKNHMMMDEQIMGFRNIFDVSYYKNKKMKDLSMGTLQKYLLNRAFSEKSKIIILDEPFNYLDENSSKILESEIIKSTKIIILVDNTNKQIKPTKLFCIEGGFVNEKN